MTVDIEPIVREPSDFERFFMKFHGWKRIFYFMQDGKQHSVHWTDENIKDFLPNWTVSEYMENHLQKYASIFAHCMESWEKKQHPYWTAAESIEVYPGKRSYTGKEVPQKLIDRHVTDSAKY